MDRTILAGELLALAALAIFSGNIILTKVASTRIGLSAGFVVAVSANIVFAAALATGQYLLLGPPVRWDWGGVALYAAAGAFTTWLGRWFFFESIARLGPARASVFQVSSPLFVAAIAWLALGERIALAGVVGILVTIAGLLLVSMAPAQLARAVPAAAVAIAVPVRRRADRLREALVGSGLLLGVASSAAYAVGNVLRGGAIRRLDEPVLGALLGAVAGLALHLIASRGDRATLASLRRAPRAGILLFAISGSLTITAQVFTIAAMRHVPVAIVALITLCTPLLVFPASFLLLGNQERITLRTIGGALMALVGIALLLLG